MALMSLKRVLPLMLLAVGAAAAPAAAQTTTRERWIALGIAASVTTSHSIHDADSDVLVGEAGSRRGIGFDIRGKVNPRFGIALTGEYLFKSGEGPLREGGRAQAEGDFFLNTQGKARVYVGAVGGSEYASYDGLSGGQSFQGTRLVLGPVVGVLIGLGQRARLGVSAEYLIGTSPYTRSYKDGVAGEPPKLATPGTLVVKARMLFITVQ